MKIKFNVVYSRTNLSKTKDVEYILNLDEHKSIETRWIALYVNDNKKIYFKSFGVKHIPKEITKFSENKYIIKNIYRIHVCN